MLKPLRRDSFSSCRFNLVASPCLRQVGSIQVDLDQEFQIEFGCTPE